MPTQQRVTVLLLGYSVLRTACCVLRTACCVLRALHVAQLAPAQIRLIGPSQIPLPDDT
jgi:hypothetical protein